MLRIKNQVNRYKLLLELDSVSFRILLLKMQFLFKNLALSQIFFSKIYEKYIVQMKKRRKVVFIA